MDSISNINIIVPKSWAELSVKQLYYVYSLMTRNMSAVEIKTYCLLKWGGLTVKFKYADGYMLKIGKVEFVAKADLICSAANALNWLEALPVYPINLKKIGWHKAIVANFEGVPFEKYIMCDNLFQGYLSTQNDELLCDMAQILYNTKKIKLSPAEKISIFYWFAALKDLFARSFTHFLKPMPSSNPNLLGNEVNVASMVRDAMNAQIRALTKGDVTKENEVLALDTWRAFAELDAIAKDFEYQQNELAKYGKH